MNQRTYSYECFGCGAREEREVDPKMRREQWCASCGNYMKLLVHDPIPAFLLAQSKIARNLGR